MKSYNFNSFEPHLERLNALTREFDNVQCEIAKINFSLEDQASAIDIDATQIDVDERVDLARRPYYQLSEEARVKIETENRNSQRAMLESLDPNRVKRTSVNLAPPTLFKTIFDCTTGLFTFCSLMYMF